MSRWVPIQYHAFWDRPRLFLAEESDHSVLFDCRFDDNLDEYPDFYRIYRMPPLNTLSLHGSWNDLQTQAVAYLGEVPVQRVRFDPTLRREVDLEVLATLRQGA
jgi:hypothetical protein